MNKNENEPKPRRRKLIVVVPILVVLAVCLLLSAMVLSRAPERASEERRYELTGVVKSVDRAKRSATIKHEKVADFMEAMTMPFVIKDAKALNEIKVGNRIRATLVVTDEGGQWLESIIIITSAG